MTPRRSCASLDRLRPGDPEQGTVTAFTALAALALLLMVGLVVDGGGRMRAVGKADRIASETARAAVEAADTRGRTLTIDRPAAIVAANAVVLNDVVVPPGALAVGTPATIKPDRARADEIAHNVATYVARSSRYRYDLRRID